MRRWGWNLPWIVLVATPALLATAGSLRAQDAPPAQDSDAAKDDAVKDDAAKIEDLEQRLKILERKDELQNGQTAEKEKQAPIVTAAGKDGFTIRTGDGASFLRIRG